MLIVLPCDWLLSLNAHNSVLLFTFLLFTLYV